MFSAGPIFVPARRGADRLDREAVTEDGVMLDLVQLPRRELQPRGGA